MSLVPVTPNMKMKSFWQKPEGVTGGIVMAGLVLGGAYLLKQALPWIISLLSNAIYATGLGFVAFALLVILTDRKFWQAASTLYKIVMRKLTNLVYTIDPIETLEVDVDRMVERSHRFDTAVTGCAEAKHNLEARIDQNNSIINHNRSLIKEVEREIAIERDPVRRQTIALREHGYKEEIGRRATSNDNLQKILSQNTRIYELLQRYQSLVEYNIQNTKATVRNAKDERESVLRSYKAMSLAQRLIKGDPEELRARDAALEFLAEDNASKIGAMDDFANYSKKFLDDMDIERGASVADAERMLAEYEKKLLTVGTTETVPSNMPYADAVPVPRSTKAIEGDYIDFKK